ncbi:hypothetical protein NIIDNTM18_02290 [Mycolicibacterium litorale]|uniref:Acyl-CoA dehydrogenase/oxidase C-terminal domain-containing protein n=1 Tax=Mycolicibacterium litorale TaxID=758802 RepID=A0A6S6P0F2_9MYCO|nr:hypothetical protein NIIDNTM18_02290 [Mycolicibacterium litorale]
MQGRDLAPGPVLPTVAAAAVLDRCGGDEVGADLLPGLSSGSIVAALGLTGTLTVGGDGSVTGQCPAVLGAPDADLLVLVAGDDVVVLDAHAAGVTVTALDGIDPTRSIGAVTVNDVRISPARVLPGARTVFRILGSAEAVGVGWACLDMAVEYAKVREQFGRTIGDLDSAWFPAAVAASHAIRASVFLAQNTIQLHGGIGYTWEHDAHLYLRRARALAALLGGGTDPLVDVVDAQRSGRARGASFALPAASRSTRCVGSPARPTSTRCSSTACSSPTQMWSAT